MILTMKAFFFRLRPQLLLVVIDYKPAKLQASAKVLKVSYLVKITSWSFSPLMVNITVTLLCGLTSAEITALLIIVQKPVIV